MAIPSQSTGGSEKLAFRVWGIEIAHHASVQTVQPIVFSFSPDLSMSFRPGVAPVRASAPLLVLCLAAVLATGCMQIENTVTIRPDGSGEITERVVVTSEMLEMMAMMDESDAADMFTEQDIRDRTPYPGTELASVTMIDDMDGQGYTSTYTFADIRDVTFRPALDEIHDDSPDGQVDAPDGMLRELDLAFTPGPPATLTVRMPEAEDDSDIQIDTSDTSSAMPDMSDLRILRMMLRDARFRVAVIVDGTIVETDATYRSDNEITLYDFDFNEVVRDSTALRRFAEAGETDRPDAGQLAGIPGIRIEQRETVTVRFE